MIERSTSGIKMLCAHVESDVGRELIFDAFKEGPGAYEPGRALQLRVEVYCCFASESVTVSRSQVPCACWAGIIGIRVAGPGKSRAA